MNAKNTVELHRKRRTQEERTSTTRAKVIAGAIDCLYRLGYAGTTTTIIAKAAGVSRGAMLHHFPTKDGLLIAVASEVLSKSLQGLSEQLLAIQDPQERLLALPELSWADLQSPDYIAWLEILLGTRGNEELRQQFGQTYEAANKQAAKSMRAMAVAAGVKDLARMERMRIVVLAALRGMAIEGAITSDFKRLKPAVMEMRTMLAQVVEEQAAVPASPPVPRSRSG